MLFPLIAAVWSVIRSVSFAMAELQRSGSADPAALAGEISMILLSMLWGAMFVFIALIALVICLVFYRKHRKEALRMKCHSAVES